MSSCKGTGDTEVSSCEAGRATIGAAPNHGTRGGLSAIIPVTAINKPECGCAKLLADLYRI